MLPTKITHTSFPFRLQGKVLYIFLCNKFNSCRLLQPILNKGLASTIRPISHHFYQHLCKITFHVYIYLITTYCPTYSKVLLSVSDFNIIFPFSFSPSKTRDCFFSGLPTKKIWNIFSTPCQNCPKWNSDRVMWIQICHDCKGSGERSLSVSRGYDSFG